jgi:hypothetical protein
MNRSAVEIDTAMDVPVSQRLTVVARGMILCPIHGLNAVFDVDLLEDVINMRFDRTVADIESARDLFVGVPGCHVLKNLLLLVRKQDVTGAQRAFSTCSMSIQVPMHEVTAEPTFPVQ